VGQREGPIEAYLVDEVVRRKGRIRKLAWIGRIGAPDRLVWWPGPRHGFVECKGRRADGSAPARNPPQEREIARLRADGWRVYVVETRTEVDRALDEIQSGGLI
jgi:hypothetical protein